MKLFLISILVVFSSSALAIGNDSWEAGVELSNQQANEAFHLVRTSDELLPKIIMKTLRELSQQGHHFFAIEHPIHPPQAPRHSNFELVTSSSPFQYTLTLPLVLSGADESEFSGVTLRINYFQLFQPSYEPRLTVLDYSVDKLTPIPTPGVGFGNQDAE